MHTEGLDQSLGFAIGVTYRKISGLLFSRFRALDLTPEQWAVLYRVGERDGQIQKEIAERSGKDKPTTTRILDALEAKGFIEKKPGAHDRRSFEVSITDKGRRTVELAAPVERETIRDACEGLTPDQYARMLEWLRAINGNVDRLNHQETE